MNEANAPPARTGHAAVYVDGQFIIFGGALTSTGAARRDTAGYDVGNDTWTALASMNGARCDHVAVADSVGIYTFGGLENCGDGTTVGAGTEVYTPDSDGGTWLAYGISDEPSARYNTTAVWTGTKLLLYGGGDAHLPTLATGGLKYGLLWDDASCSLPGCDRSQGVMFLDGNVVRFMGGSYNPVYPTPPSAIVDAANGLAFDLTDKSWSTWPHPAGTTEHIAYHYADDGRRIYFLRETNLVTVYDRASSSWAASDDAEWPTGLCKQAATTWSDSEMIAWSGDCGTGAVAVGGRFQPRAP